MKVIKLAYLILINMVIAISGCNKLIEAPPATDQITTDQVFADSLQATSALSGIYVVNFPYLSTLSGINTYDQGLSADELVTSSVSYIPFYQNVLVASSANTPGGSASSFWTGAYTQTIYPANAIIEGVTASKTLSPTLKSRLIGECEVFRSLSYFNLSNLFGAVPLALTTVVRTNVKLARVSQDSAFNLLSEDLSDAVNRLPIAYPTEGHARPNKYTAMALLAKVQLYHKLWSAAESSSTAIIQSGMYTLETDLNQVFLSGSREAIWQVAGMGTYSYATSEGLLFLPYFPGTIPTITINPYLLSAFEVNDHRKSQWLSSNTSDGIVRYFPYKYKNGYTQQNGSTVEEYVVFRLAEQYLIRAEARIEQGKLADGAADLNLIRNRAGLPNTMASSQADLLKAVMHERQTEMFCEWGNRWFDLKRTGTVNAVLSVEKAGAWPADGHAALYPIPANQIMLDPALTQNPGY